MPTANVADCGGIAAPFAAFSFVHWIIFFIVAPDNALYTLSSMIQPSPPPIPMDSSRLLSQPWLLRLRNR